MNQEFIRIEFDADGHPEETILVLALEGELSEQDADQIEAHMRVCQLCRARVAEIEHGFAVYEEYRTDILLPEILPGPQSFREFPTRLRQLSEERVSRDETRKQSGAFLRGLVPARVPFRWVGVAASVMAAILFVTQVLLNPVRLSATELLERAAASQNPSVATKAGSQVKKAHQRVRISSGGTTVIRDFQWTVGSSIPNVSWQDVADPAKWSAPLTAEGFSQWRNSVAQKKDQVQRTGEQWTLDTKASESSIREAWIVVRASDFHPTKQHISFADNRSLDFEELAFDFTDDQVVASPVPEAPNVAAQQSATPTLPTRIQSPDPNEAELELRYTMFQKEWDLGEDLEIASTGNEVIVSGAASSQDRAEAIREALGLIAGVRLAILSPPQAGGSPVSRAAPSSANPSPLAKDLLEKSLPDSGQRRDSVYRWLSASDDALAHASVLQKLAERYDAAAKASLAPTSQAKLHEMLRIHMERLRLANSELDAVMQFLMTPAPARIAFMGNGWRDAIRALFAQVREQDSLVAALIVGSQTARIDARTASARVKSLHESIQNLLANAQTLLSAPNTAK